MGLSVTNTLTGEREAFEPADDGEVLLYVCGLTVSDDAHLGHARLWFHADVLHRWLDWLGYDVRHVENVTDVNEKIAARVGEREGWETEADVARHFTREVLADMRGLNLKRAAVYPRVSEHIPEIVALVERLIEAGHAYETNGSVYFDVTSFEGYGGLSNQDPGELEADEAAALAEKRHPADFALWKAGGVGADAVREHRKHDHGGDLPSGRTWESPWGEGRPGWHIECSAMSTTHLGDGLDVHMGGRDLVFPHHENEIAQSEAATGGTFARYWLHSGLLETGEDKMSSSLGNFFAVEDALEEFGVNVVRTFYLGARYRGDQAFSEAAIAEAEERWERLERAYETAAEACDSVDARAKATDDDLRTAVDDAHGAFVTAMNDDLNVREAFGALLDLGTAVNRHVERVDAADGGNADAYDYPGLRRAVETFETFGGDVFGLELGRRAGGDAELVGDLADLVLDVREAERAAGNYERADRLRDDLEALGLSVEDGEDGPEVRFD
ncbi:cysteine--tRNA ligase [Halobacteriales archaeon QS_6_71_20]|nr:MAG: cysteine--tRNA ligase [Halobacteriales archaeon QS_6_71_20]